MESKFVRYQASNPNGRGSYPGIFALANGLARDGKRSDKDWVAWRKANNHFDSGYTDPSTVDKLIYDRAINSSAQSWFHHTATDLFVGV